ncbi:beta strand repeat-containing protein [Spirosoma aerolatum]|uniref:beta strand repeat-containing protein n=1 Tax=Spirosoma aerolatum TaxID=1211326 RepID=UPI0009AE957B|nr:hypothetical protein [Spirosoma aerolatum]
MKHAILACWLLCLLVITNVEAQTCTLTLNKSYDYLSTGQSSILSYVGCTGGTVTWDHGLGTGNNKTVSPTATTTYSATCTPASGAPCSQSITVNFINCSVSASASPSIISSGQSTVLSYTGCVGGSVDWVDSRDNGIGSGNNLTVTPTASITYIAQCNKDNGYCLSYVTVTVSNCSITASASTTSVNAGQSSILSYTGCTGGTVSWDNGVGTGNNKTVSPSATTTYTATCSPAGGGSTCSSSVRVSVTPCSVIALASSTTINAGQSTELVYENCTNGTVSWDHGAGTGNNLIVSPSITTTYQATCTPTGGGTPCTNSVTVTVIPCTLSLSASPASISTGQSSLLTYTGCSNGTVTWSNGLGSGNNKTVTPSLTTTYSATCTPSGGGNSCTGSVSVTVNSPCSIGASASPSTINAGQSTVLSYTGCSGGTVSWDNGVGTGNSKTVSPSVTTTYVATCTPAGGGGTCSSSVSVTVTACSVLALASSTTINSGQTTTLAYENCTNGTVSWDQGAGNGNSIVVSPSVTTTYQATCTPRGGGSPCTSSVTITVNTCGLSLSASPSTVNAGQNSVLTYTGCSNGTVSWDNGLGTGNSKTVSPTLTTTYSATCTPTGGGNVCTSSVTVTVSSCNFTVTASPSTINAGQSSVLSYSGCSNGTVSWDNGLGSGNSKTVSPSATTTYQATCTPTGGGTPCTSSITISVVACNLTASANPANINAGQSSALTYTGCTNGTVSWSDGLGSGNTKSVTPSSTTTYSVTCTPSGGGSPCTSSVTVTVSSCNFTVTASPSTINAGQNSVLSYSGCSNGTVSWDNGLGSGNSKTVSPSATTTYQATCTPTGGGTPCTSSITVTVNTCNLTLSASPATINAGQSSVLTYTGCSNGTVSWDNGLGTGNSKTVSPTLTTTYSATCTPTGGGNVCTNSVVVTVNSCNFTLSASPSTINAGQSSVLSYSGCNGGTVTWNNGLGTGNSKTVTPVITTTYSATCAPNGGGSFCTSLVIVTVNACSIAVNASPSTINAGQSSVLTYTGCSNGTVSWDNGIGTGNSKTVSPSATTTYTGTCTPTGGGTPCTNSVTITVNALPCSLTTSATSTTINTGVSTVLSYSGCTGGTVTWNNGLGTGNTKTVSPSTTTVYQATCVPAGGGSSCTSSLTITVHDCSFTTSASSATINAGQSAVLSYTGCTYGLVSWDHGVGTGNDKIVSPSVTTTYLAVCAPKEGGSTCTEFLTVTVIPCNLNASASSVNINAGQSSVLTYTGCSNGTVTWDNGLGTGNNKTVTPSSTTTYLATCIPNGGGASCSSSVTITVSTCNFIVGASPANLNAGQSSVVSYTGCSNGTVSWDNGLGSGNSKTVSPSATTTYQATCTPTGGGTPCTSSITVTVNTCNLTLYASPATINAGQSSALTYTGCTNGTVSWSDGLGSGNTKSVTPSSTTTYSVTCTPSGGGSPCTSSVTVNVNSCNFSVGASPSSINTGQNSILSYSGCANGAVSWDNGVGNGNNLTVNPTVTTTYQATCTPNSGGTPCTSSITVTVNGCSLSASASPSAINAGQNAVLTYSGCSNGTVSWDNGLGTGNNKPVNPSVTTTYIATCTPNGGGTPCTSSVTIQVDGCTLSASANPSTLNAGQRTILTYTGCANGTVSWDNGLGTGSTQTVSPSVTTTYKATCTPSGGGTPCTSLVTVTVTSCNLTTSTTLSSLNAGQSALLTYTGCENGTVSWDNGVGSGNNKTVNPSATTTYVATCTPTGGGNACTSSITISVNPCTIGSTASPATINAGQSSILTYTGCPNGTVSWDNGIGAGNAKTVSPTVTTTYIASCTPDGGGTPCTSPVTVNVIQCSISSAVSPSRINVGQSATLSYTGCPNGTVSWDNGLGSGNTKMVMPTTTTTYRATCIPAGGGNSCTEDVTLTVTPAPIAISSSSVKKPSCVDVQNGSLTLTLDRRIVTGERIIRLTLSRNNSLVETYLFEGPSFTTPETLGAGTYSVLIETLIGSSPSAQTTASITIANPDPVTFSLTKTDVNCFGGADGKVEILAAGGTGVYAYQLAAAGTAGFANGNRHLLTDRLPGTYTLQVFDSNNCSAGSQSITVSQPTGAVVLTKVSQKDPRGFETKDGQAVVQVAGGTPGYTFEWLDETDNSYGTGVTTGTTNKNSTLRGGTYRVRVYDARYSLATQKGGCSSVVSFSLTEPPIIEARIDLTSAVSCFGKKDGVILVTPKGGVPFTKSTAYALSLQSQSNPAIQIAPVRNSFGSLPAGLYTLTVTDSNEVSRTFSYSLAEPQKVISSVVSTKDLACNGDKNGSIEIAAIGGNGGYTASWSNNAKGLKISNLSAGVYTGVVSDAKGCRSDILYVSINEPVRLEAAFKIKSPTCYSTCDGTIDAGISGGVRPYSFVWDGRAEKATRLEKLCGGESLSFKVADANGCQLTKTAQIVQPTKIDLNLGSERKVCQGQTVLLDATNALAQSYRWTLPDSQTANTPTLEAKQPGTYSLSVFDKTNCEFKSTVAVKQVQNTGKIRFAATSTGPVDEPIVILNLSDPAPLTTDWITPATATILEKTAARLQFSLPTLGDYTIGIKAAFAECELYQTKKITIVDAFPKQVQFDPGELTLSVSPNPTVADVAVNLLFKMPTSFSMKLYALNTPDTLLFEIQETDKTNYSTTINALPLNAGVYVLSVDVAGKIFSKRIIVVK